MHGFGIRVRYDSIAQHHVSHILGLIFIQTSMKFLPQAAMHVWLLHVVHVVFFAQWIALTVWLATTRNMHVC